MDVTCEPQCDDCDLWAMKCVGGECVKDYIIEENSSKCGPECPCMDVTCEPQCDGYELWATKCVNGECVKDYIIEKYSSKCGYVELLWVVLPVTIIIVIVVLISKKKKSREEREPEEKSHVLICPQCKNRIQKDWDTCPYCKVKLK